jgi:hypothetical protein
VKEGTKSKLGSVLKKAFSFSFITNPPRVFHQPIIQFELTDCLQKYVLLKIDLKVIHCFPYNEAIVRTLKPFFFLVFDQRIDPKKVLPHIRYFLYSFESFQSFVSSHKCI